MAKDTQQRTLIGQLTLGAGFASGIVALAGTSPALLTWALTNPDKAVTIGLVTAETAAAITSGAVTPTSLADGLGQSLGRGLTAAEKASVQELASTLRVVGQQRLLAEQPQKLAEMANLFSKGGNGTLTFAGQHLAPTAESNLIGTAKVFDTGALTNFQLEERVFDYVSQLTAGQTLKPILKEGVALEGRWTTTIADGTTINLRSYSSSGVARWTIDVKNSPYTKLLKPGYEANNYELKFK